MKVAAAAFVALAVLGAATASGTRRTFPGVNGEIVYFSDDAPNLRNLELYAVSATGGPARHAGDGDPAPTSTRPGRPTAGGSRSRACAAEAGTSTSARRTGR